MRLPRHSIITTFDAVQKHCTLLDGIQFAAERLLKSAVTYPPSVHQNAVDIKTDLIG